MNRHSRVLPFPPSRGKEKDKAVQHTSGVKSSDTKTSSSSKGVAKSGIKGVKGLVSSLSAAKINHSNKEKPTQSNYAPSISATLAASSVGKSEEVEAPAARGGTIHGKEKDLQRRFSFEPSLPTCKEDSVTPVSKVKSLENAPGCKPCTENLHPSGETTSDKLKTENSPVKSMCSVENIGVKDANNGSSDGETDDNCTCKQKQQEHPTNIPIVGKNKVNESIREHFRLRLLCPDDVPEVKALCSDWFPVEYPDSWYTDITSDKRFHSLAAIINDKIVGLLVSEVKARARLHREDSTILSSAFPSITQVAYILSLGVVSTFRRLGIATALLTNLLNYLNTHEKLSVKAVYLHVLASNTSAISFYEKHNFRRHEYLPYYYAIRGKGKDGLSYVLYINGGQPPWTLLDYMKLVGAYISRMQPSSLPSAMAHRTRNFIASRRSWLPSLPSFPSMPSMPSVNLPSMNMNILQRFRGQGSSQDPEVGLSPEEAAELEGEEDVGRNRSSWLPSVNYYSLLQRFGGQCYDSGEQPDFEDIESAPRL